MTNNNKSNNIKILENIFNKYAFNNKNIMSIMDNILNKKNVNKNVNKNVKNNEKNIDIKKVKKKINIKQNNFHIPEHKDNLFWCWIIFKYGKGKYFDLKNKEFSVEKKYKIKFIEPIRKRKKDIKKFKVKICDIEANLANERILCLNILEIMLYIQEYNFIFINDKIYYENMSYPENKTCIIKYFHNLEKYGLFLENETNKKIIDDFKEKLFNVENIKKPIKSISAYKAQEIRDICHTLNINAMKTPTKYKTKKDLYQLICETIM